jgi:hypothetical protein
MQETEVTFDHNYLYINQERFFPIIQEQNLEFENLEAANAILISVPAHPHADLSWESQYEYAEKAVEKGKWILWELDFGFESSPVFIQDSSLFYSFGIAIEEFAKKLWRPFRHRSLGVCLFRGDVDFSKRFIWTDQHQEFFLEKILDYPFVKEKQSEQRDREEECLRNLFAADVFADYLHRLSSFLPESLLPFCLLDVSSVESSAFLSHLLSKERFQHILLALKKAKIPLGHLNWEEGACFGGWIGQYTPYFSAVSQVKIGVCIPSEEKMSQDLYSLFDRVFQEFNQNNIPFRVISEHFLNESWDGIDDLIVLSASLSEQGKRKLCGFHAAGGRIISIGNALNFANEHSWDEYVKTLAPSEAFF